MEDATQTETVPWFLQITRPVDFPECEAFKLPKSELDSYIQTMLKGEKVEAKLDAVADADSLSPFMDGLLKHNMTLKTRTRNGDQTFASSGNCLVDLFNDADDDTAHQHLEELLTTAWREDPLMTLKIIFNSRSIHLGKGTKTMFYRCAGWLAQEHPLTLVSNLQWLARPVIEKKVQEKKPDEEGDLVMVEDEKDEEDVTDFDVEFGVSHGSWKDLLNILALAARGELSITGDLDSVLHVQGSGKKHGGGRGGHRRGRVGRAHEGIQRKEKKEPEDSKQLRQEKRQNRHTETAKQFQENAFYHTLHVTVARLFADQLREDIAALRSNDPKAIKRISLCAKWAPSDDLFHDNHTVIVSSISGILFPRACFTEHLAESANRETYLRHARERYRQTVSALRKRLDIVERKITANAFDTIKYAKVPSLAMGRYKDLFLKKDQDGFLRYLDDVVSGKAKTSGAILLPSTLVKAVQTQPWNDGRPSGGNLKEMLASRLALANSKLLDGQWATLVDRIKKSGTLDNSIAVCDVSGSMGYPVRNDGTTPMHSAIGLSLLLAEVARPPFAGAFITFSGVPSVERVDLTDTLTDKVHKLARAHWDMNTDFVAVFESLILPMAIKNKLAPEDMIKRVFVFSDMQFDAAQSTSSSTGQWNSSFEHIKAKYTEAGYEMPELVFWNLAGQGGQKAKPVDAEQKGAALVSGYSQAMLKVFMSGGGFDEDEDKDEDEDTVVIGQDGEEVSVPKEKKQLDPLRLVKRAVGHRAYSMLKVLD